MGPMSQTPPCPSAGWETCSALGGLEVEEAGPRGQYVGVSGDQPWILFLELDADPYDPTEEDPAQSRALESSLWELQVRAP